MKLVVDTNVLFSFFWKLSGIRDILLSRKMDLFSPEYALEEINKYQKEICTKANLSSEEFEKERLAIALAVQFISVKEYASKLKQALSFSPDENDIDFLALALLLGLPLWSNDAKLKKQQRITILTTMELLDNPEFIDAFYGEADYFP